MKAIITIALAVGLFSVVPTAGAQNEATSSLLGNVPQVTGNDEFCLETAAEHLNVYTRAWTSVRIAPSLTISFACLIHIRRRATNRRKALAC